MTNLQEYLNKNYSTKNERELVKKINSNEIKKRREKEGLTELLEGGELDLREFKNLEEVRIDREDLKTPLFKVEVDGLTKLKELVWTSEIIEETEEEKKLFTELGISEDNEKKRIVREIKKLAELFSKQKLANKKINVYFATEKAPKEQLKDEVSIAESKDNEFNVYLSLERKDKVGNFSANPILWSFTQELTILSSAKYDKDPLYWNHFWDEEMEWIKDNISSNYKKEWELLLNPSTFPHNLLEIKDLHKTYFPDLINQERTVDSQSIVGKEIIDKAWIKIRQELVEIIDKEIKKLATPSEEKLKELGIKATVNYDFNKAEYAISVNYNPQNPVKIEIEKLILATPLKLEIEYLKKKREEMPTTENFDKLSKQKKELEDYLQNFVDEKVYQKIEKKLDKII